jgi:hypothetical protein
MRNLNDIHYRTASVFADRTAAELRMALFARKTAGSHAALAARSTA